LPARTSLACDGAESPWQSTSSPLAESCLLKSIMNAMCASMSCFGQLMIWYSPPAGVFIISMNFIRLTPVLGDSSAPRGVLSGASRSRIGYFDTAGENFFRRASE
jgi:hypothetical protein